jgi:hypothetical protein
MAWRNIEENKARKAACENGGVALKGENIGENESMSAACSMGARKRNGGVSAAMAAWRGGEMAASAASALNGVSKKMASAARINIAM